MWRLTQGDVFRGVLRRLRRARGVYLEDSVHDNTEYHANRNGVDQEAILKLTKEQGWACEVLPYFSTQSGMFQGICSALAMVNTFAVIAQRAATEE